MGRQDAPRFGVEVVGAIAHVLGDAEWMAFVGDDDDATRCFSRQRDGFVAQVGDGLWVADIDHGRLCIERLLYLFYK